MGSLEIVAQAKSELVQALPADGYAILNIDDPRVRAMAEVTRRRGRSSTGSTRRPTCTPTQIESRGLGGIAFRAHYAGDSVVLKLPLLGRHSVHTALAAAAAGLLLGLGWDAIVDGLRDESAQLRLLAVPGIGGATLIDDTYNASPASSLAALNLLAELDGRRIVVLGDMLELGPIEEEAHRIVGRRVAEVADLLIAVGQRARWIADEARLSGMGGRADHHARHQRGGDRAAGRPDALRRLCADQRIARRGDGRDRGGAAATTETDQNVKHLTLYVLRITHYVADFILRRTKRARCFNSGAGQGHAASPVARRRRFCADARDRRLLGALPARKADRQADPRRRPAEPYDQDRHADDGRHHHPAAGDRR